MLCRYVVAKALSFYSITMKVWENLAQLGVVSSVVRVMERMHKSDPHLVLATLLITRERCDNQRGWDTEISSQKTEDLSVSKREPRRLIYHKLTI